MIRTVIKRNGQPAWFDPDRLNKWAEWAADIGVDWTSVVLDATRKCSDGCSTADIHAALIAACVDQETTAHLKMAGRLYMGKLYKDTFGTWRSLPTVKEMYHSMVERGMWAKMDYSDEELDICEGFIDHSLDINAPLTETKQVMDKYACFDRVDGKAYETPQFVYMRMALGNMEKMPKDRRMEDVKELYQRLASHKINPPSPFSLNLGTPKKQYASCCTVSTTDSAASLAVADHIAYRMTCASAGIGANLRTRSKGDKVRGGAIKHMGKLPYYRVQEAAVSANLQAGRGGALTMHYTVLDPEFWELIRLKNVETIPEMQVKGIDYSVGYNREFARRVAANEPWMLVSYGDAPRLHDLMYQPDIELFKAEFEAVQANPLVKKVVVPARKIAIAFLTEAYETGRVFEHATDEMNRHTPFLDPIYLSNLCQEIGLPTEGYDDSGSVHAMQALYSHSEDVKGEIGLCSLGAIAQGLEDDDEDYEKTAYYTCLMIDNVIEIMEYPFPNLEMTAKARRSIGVGITNLAYDMAKRGLKYDTQEGKLHIARVAERHSYMLHKAAIRLTKERGACKWTHRTRYSQGWLPVDTGCKEVQNVVGFSLVYDWEALRKELIALGGLRFSVIEAHMPCESSSLASGHTNGLYPIREHKVIKTSGINKNLFICPEYDTLKDAYQMAWDVPTMDLIECYAIVQFFSGQAVSADIYKRYDPDNRRVSATVMLQEWLYRVKLGMKTRYYINSATGVKKSKDRAEEQELAACESCAL